MKLCHGTASIAMLSLAIAAPITSHMEAEMEAEMQIYARHAPLLTCATGVHIITVGGNGVKSVGKRGMTKSLSESIMDAIPGSTSKTLPHDITPRKRSSKAITEDSESLLNWIDLYHAHCPESKIVILGHSSVSRLMRRRKAGIRS